ncbi:hypothetical protein RCL1_005509 [Eukaryota sp. TZLM3-RCL]
MFSLPPSRLQLQPEDLEALKNARGHSTPNVPTSMRDANNIRDRLGLSPLLTLPSPSSKPGSNPTTISSPVQFASSGGALSPF